MSMNEEGCGKKKINITVLPTADAVNMYINTNVIPIVNGSIVYCTVAAADNNCFNTNIISAKRYMLLSNGR